MKDLNGNVLLPDIDCILSELSLCLDSFIFNFNKTSSKGINRKVLVAALLTRVDSFLRYNIKPEQNHLIQKDIIFLFQSKLLPYQSGINAASPSINFKLLQTDSAKLCCLLNLHFDPFKALNATEFPVRNVISKTELKKQPQASKQRMSWTGKGKLEELVFQLQQHKLIRTKKDFFNLFYKPEVIQTRIKWDFKRISHLALLFHELYVNGFVRLLSNKGYFNFVENHFEGFDNSTIRKNSLRKISSSIHLHPYKYSDVITDITGIVQKLIPFSAMPSRTIEGRLMGIKPA